MVATEASMAQAASTAAGETGPQENLNDYVRTDLSDSLWLPTSLPEEVLQRLYKQ